MPKSWKATACNGKPGEDTDGLGGMMAIAHRMAIICNRLQLAPSEIVVVGTYQYFDSLKADFLVYTDQEV
jgi:hypothetical protein